MTGRSAARIAELLACPACRSSLTLEPDEARCATCGAGYPILEGVPRFTQNGEPRESLLARIQYAILGNPRVYDFQQAHFGAQPVVDRLRDRLRGLSGATVLDIGAGTGVVAGLLGPGNTYIWLDNDVQKLRGFVSRGTGDAAVLGDAARLPFGDRVADWTLMVEVSHHIPDEALDHCLAEAARVTNDRFLFVDAIRGPRLRSRLMWNFDLGRYPRPPDELRQIIGEHFDIHEAEPFRGVNHDHVQLVCAPTARATETRL